MSELKHVSLNQTLFQTITPVLNGKYIDTMSFLFIGFINTSSVIFLYDYTTYI